MKNIFPILIIFVLFSCQSSRKASSPSRQISPEINCPEGGNCSFEILKNSKLNINTDEFGKLYPEVVSGDQIVIKYHFKKNEIKNTADSNYSEYVYLEINEDQQQIILKDNELSNVKLIFGRICFCRDSMGYFKVTQGKLFLFNKNNKLTINLSFDVKNIPQITKEINESIIF